MGQRGQGTVRRMNRGKVQVQQKNMKVGNKNNPHMKLRIIGEDDREKSKFIKYYSESNRKGKRDIIRQQKRDNINHRKETTNGAFGQSKLQRIWNKRLYALIIKLDFVGKTIKSKIAMRNTISKVSKDIKIAAIGEVKAIRRLGIKIGEDDNKD